MFRLPYSPTFVHILVGPNQKDFAIHRNLICQLSGFFDAAFNGSFSEASSGVIELYEEDPDLFELVYKWCYMKDTAQYNDGQSIMCGAEQIVRLWVLGDRYDMPGTPLATSLGSTIVSSYFMDVPRARENFRLLPYSLIFEHIDYLSKAMLTLICCKGFAIKR